MVDQEYLQAWKHSLVDAKAALWLLGRLIERFESYQESGDFVSREEFLEVLGEMREQGLEGWLDGHPLDCDQLYEVVTGVEP